MTVALPSPVEGVSSVEVYRVPVPDPRITLKLDTNEGPAPAPELRAILAELEREPINRYPNAGDLEADLAEMHGVAPAQVFVGAGLDDALMRLMIAYTGTGRRVLVTRPTFAMIPHYLGVTRAETVELDWWEGAYPIERASEAARDATIAFFVTPNNPTGLAAGADDLARLSAAMPGGLLVADLAYGEFADTDLLPVALGLPNVVTLRTFSKAWGMAGLRVGYAIGPEPVIEAVRKAGQPFSVPSSSLAVARAWLPHGADFARRTADRVRHERGVLAELLQRKGGAVTPSQANFVLVRLESNERAGAWQARLRERGVAVRRYTKPEQLAACVRITCPGGGDDFDKLCTILKETDW